MAPARAKVGSRCDRYPHILTDFNSDDETRHVICFEQQIGAEGRAHRTKRDFEIGDIPA